MKNRAQALPCELDLKKKNFKQEWQMYDIFLCSIGTFFTNPEHSWAQQLSGGHLNSDKWCPSPSGSALWPPLPPGWRPGPWSCLPCDPLAVWTAHRSGSSTRLWGWSEQTQHLWTHTRPHHRSEARLNKQQMTSDSVTVPTAERLWRHNILTQSVAHLLQDWVRHHRT